ncbi:hypothetical protein FDH96_gp118 [Mycobacterium phage Rey]|uniref:Uncharacterized protein n=1 Tax=Mycobacterium phage Rey TaxID=1034115 RepID=G1D5K1_9CAUD|nr:hypothetical protein FDH96_gp118 [Mycobacterium phage Rey]AEK10049.1 hypothetical protein PBI_REY_161 [Mycobacterium phage Rey]
MPLVVRIDLDSYAADYGTVGRRGARSDIRQTILEMVQHQLKLSGIDATVSLRQYKKATE